MSKLEKLLARIKNNPKTVSFKDLEKVLLRDGYQKRQPRGGSSHYIFKKGRNILSVPYNTPFVKECYVEQAIIALNENEIEGE